MPGPKAPSLTSRVPVSRLNPNSYTLILGRVESTPVPPSAAARPSRRHKERAALVITRAANPGGAAGGAARCANAWNASWAESSSCSTEPRSGCESCSSPKRSSCGAEGNNRERGLVGTAQGVKLIEKVRVRQQRMHCPQVRTSGLEQIKMVLRRVCRARLELC